MMHSTGHELEPLDELLNDHGHKRLDTFKIWCTYFFPSVVGSWHFKGNASKKTLSNFLTVSNEAFALTVIKNFFERWKAEGMLAAEGKTTEGKDIPMAKWTDSTVGVIGKKTKGGWTNKGMARFNANMKTVAML
jgi:hypothetical protein